jgi:hypothetical protein
MISFVSILGHVYLLAGGKLVRLDQVLAMEEVANKEEESIVLLRLGYTNVPITLRGITLEQLVKSIS